jgi:hypothetical protein
MDTLKREEEFEGYTEGAGGGYVRLGRRRGQCPTLVRFMSFCQKTEMLKMPGTSGFKITRGQDYYRDWENGE